MTEISRQDLQNLLEQTKNKVVERMLTKADIQVLCNQLRDYVVKQVKVTHQLDQAAIKQSFVLANQSLRRSVNIEARLIAFEQELRMFRHTVDKLLQRQLNEQAQANAKQQLKQEQIEPVLSASQPAQQYEAGSLYKPAFNN